MTDKKQRRKSQTIQGGIVSILVMASLFLDLDLDQWLLTETVQSFFGALWSVMVLIGRVRANKKIQ